MRQSRIEITNLVKEVGKAFDGRKPTQAELSSFVSNLGINEGLALASLLVASWSYFFPRDQRKSRCKKKMILSGGICNAPIVHIEFDKEENKLIMVCERGHTTTKKTMKS